MHLDDAAEFVDAVAVVQRPACGGQVAEGVRVVGAAVAARRRGGALHGMQVEVRLAHRALRVVLRQLRQEADGRRGPLELADALHSREPAAS